MTTGVGKEYLEAVSRIRRRRRVRCHALVFGLCMPIFFIANVIWWPEVFWSLWPFLAWGVGLIFHAFSLINQTKKGYSEKSIREIMRTLEKK